ncbi:MAG: type II toxin-antitoxin system RelE/ParE family toxin [Sneathiellaceae bacterium]
MTGLSIEWRAAARADLLTIVDYIADENPAAAQRLKDEIEEKVANGAAPKALPAWPGRRHP